MEIESPQRACGGQIVANTCFSKKKKSFSKIGKLKESSFLRMPSMKRSNISLNAFSRFYKVIQKYKQYII